MSPTRRISFAFGVLFLLTFVMSIPALLLFQPVLDDPVGYVANGGSDNQIFFGAFLELLLIIANIGTAVVVYPLLKRENLRDCLGIQVLADSRRGQERIAQGGGRRAGPSPATEARR